MADIAVPSIATGTPVSGDHVLGDQSGVVKRFPASPPFAQLAATTGAGLVGYSSGEVYAAGTVGAAIQAGGGGGGGSVTLTGDITGTGTGTVATTLATVNSTVGSFTSANITVDAKGRITAASNGTGGSGGGGDALTTNPLSQFAATTSLQLKGVISDETGSGALVFATSPTLVTPDLGTPSAAVLTNASGTAASLTAGHVTTNANLTGDVTSVGNAATVVKINGTSLAGLATGILKNTTTTGVPSIAIAADFPTLNQNTTGSAATLTTPRNIDGQAFDGSAAITVIAPGTHAATGKTTPVDADEMPLVDSAASNVLKKLTWANLKATLKTYFDTFYAAVGTANLFTKAQTVTTVVLTSGTTVSTDASLSNNFRLVLAHNATLANPTNLSDGMILNWRIKQDATGSRTLAYGTKFKWANGTVPVLSTAAGAVDFLSASYDATDDTLVGSVAKGFA